MNEVKNLARVILRSDGSVHIAFRDVRSIYATAENIAELFSDPIEFIEKKSLLYKDSTFEINRRRTSLEDVLGLTLALVNSDKQIVCDFPELFQYLFSASFSEEEKSKSLDMKSFELETVLSDEKSFLLRYYLEFTNYCVSTPTIKKNIKLRDEVQTAIIREILNVFFEEALPKHTEATNPIVLAIFDEYAAMRTQDSNRRIAFSEFLKEKNAQYGTSYKRTNMLAKFDMIVNRGVRPPLPDKKPSVRIGNRVINDRLLALYEDYEKIVLSYREKGEPVPAQFEICQVLGEKYGLGERSVEDCIQAVRKYMKQQKE